jgi:hypothetical protein
MIDVPFLLYLDRTALADELADESDDDELLDEKFFEFGR